jgi:glutathione synthase/RimK-type ligase-like ATP-grasp enzyme
MWGMLAGVRAVDVVLVTFAGLPGGWEDDHLLAAALAQRGATVRFACWDDPSVQWSSVGVAVIRSTWDYHRRLDAFLGWADYAAAATHLVNDARTVRWNAHKGYLLELADAGVPVVPTTVVPAGTSHGLGAGEWVVKPAVSAGAERTTRDATQADLDALTADTDALVQPYLAAVEAGEVSIVCIGGEPVHAVRKIPKPGDFRTQEQHGAAVEVIPVAQPHRALAAAALASLESAPSYARVDVVDTEEGPLLMELELIEPSLWFREAPETADRLADLLLKSA